MKNGEFNPIHDYSGDISFVMYVAVTDELIKEKHEFKGNGWTRNYKFLIW